MRLKFKINPNYIFLHAINQSQSNIPFKEWKNLTNKIWENSKEVFYLLGGYEEYGLYLKKSSDLNRLAKNAIKTLNRIRRTKEFKRLIKETKQYKQFIEKQWAENKEKVFKILEELSGIKLPDITIQVYLTHPKLKNGMTVDNQTIVWGHPEEWPNYSTVYLCHEIMHILTNLDPSDITHAVIELMTDNELRIRLNNKGKYFQYPGHKHLRKLEKNILPEWKKYLKKPEKNIFNFIKNLKKKKATLLK